MRLSPITDVMDVVLLKVFSLLPLHEICGVIRRTCKRWNRLSYEMCLWKHIDMSEVVFQVLSWSDLTQMCDGVSTFIETINFASSHQLFTSDEQSLWESSLVFKRLKTVDLRGIDVDQRFLQMLCLLSDKFPVLSSIQFVKAIEDEGGDALASKLHQASRPHSSGLLSRVISLP